MSSIIETLNKIRDEFSIFSDPRDKYIFLVDLAKDLDGLSQEEKVEENRIHGCTSQAWVTSEKNGEKYGGFYTKSQIREVVAYAQERHITIVPEIELPGHSVAAIASYPHLSCTGDSINVGIDWGVYKDI